MTDQGEPRFAVYAEATGLDRPLIMIGLTFPRLIDDLVHPFEADKPFFIDGAPVTKSKLRRIKILKERASLQRNLAILHNALRTGSDAQKQKVLGDQYHVRVEAILRDSTEDVTSQVISAFNVAIRPKLKDYLPKKEELIKAAMEVFVNQLKALGSA